MLSTISGHQKMMAVFLAVCAVGLTPVASKEDRRAGFRIVVTKVGWSQVHFDGWYSVNGRQVDLGSTTTPWEFECEAGWTIEGVFRAVDSGRRIKLKVYDSGYSRRKSSIYCKADAVAFKWARPGVGPRWVGPASHPDAPQRDPAKTHRSGWGSRSAPFPDRARREGMTEGRVLLQVVVDR